VLVAGITGMSVVGTGMVGFVGDAGAEILQDVPKLTRLASNNMELSFIPTSFF